MTTTREPHAHGALRHRRGDRSIVDRLPMPDLARPTVSLVVPCFDEEQAFPHLVEALIGIADHLQCEQDVDVELVLIDDGSRDGTWRGIVGFAARDRRVRGASLSRNFGHQLALTCGYDLARGDAIVCMDADLQDPPEVVVQMVEAWRSGADVVFGVRTQRQGETRFKRWSAAAFYRLIGSLSSVQIRPDTGDFRLMSRRALDALNSMREQHRFLRGMVGWVGFRTVEVFYERLPRVAGQTKYPLRKMLRLGLDAIVSFSTFPLRLTFVFALLLSLLILGYLVVAAIRWAFFDAEMMPGWTSLILAITAFGAVNLVCVGIMGEYVGRIYEQSKGRPLYLVRDRVESAQPPDASRPAATLQRTAAGSGS